VQQLEQSSESGPWASARVLAPADIAEEDAGELQARMAAERIARLETALVAAQVCNAPDAEIAALENECRRAAEEVELAQMSMDEIAEVREIRGDE
jgi:hypothetical protein